MQPIDVIAMLRDGSCASVACLTAFDGSSVRTVRAHIHRANELLHGMAHISFSRAGNGYVMDVMDAAALDAWIERAAAIGADPARSAADERVVYLMRELLEREDWVTIADLASGLFISPQSVSADLKRVEDELSRYDLSLVRRPRRGVRVSGTEMSRRLALAALVEASLEVPVGAPVTPRAGAAAHAAAASAGAPDLQSLAAQVSRLVEGVVRSEGLSISSVALQNLAVHIVVALVRIREGRFVPMEAEQLARIQAAPEYAVARRIAEAIAELPQLEGAGTAGAEPNGAALRRAADLPVSEIAYIAIHLAGHKNLEAPAADEEVPDGGAGNLVIPDDVWDTVGAMLDVVWEAFHFVFRRDLELRMNLARHLVPLKVRLKYRMRIDNPLLADIKVRYPLAYSMALDAGRVLAERYGSELSPEEAGYIALSFALALERAKTVGARKNILVVCASGRGSARMLEHRFRTVFGEYLGSCRAADVQEVAHLDLSGIDYVFTTVPIAAALPVPICEIKYFFDDGDAAGIRGILAGAGTSDQLMEAFDERLFVPHLAARTSEEAIRALSDRLIRYAGVPPTLIDQVLAREEAAATSFGNLVAMPHPLEAVDGRTRVAVGVLDRAIAWGGAGGVPGVAGVSGSSGARVQAVFLISYARSGGRELDALFDRLADLFLDADAMRHLVEDPRWETLAGILAT